MGKYLLANKSSVMGGGIKNKIVIANTYGPSSYTVDVSKILPDIYYELSEFNFGFQRIGTTYSTSANFVHPRVNSYNPDTGILSVTGGSAWYWIEKYDVYCVY